MDILFALQKTNSKNSEKTGRNPKGNDRLPTFFRGELFVLGSVDLSKESDILQGSLDLKMFIILNSLSITYNVFKRT